jgi:hypothetical protein
MKEPIWIAGVIGLVLGLAFLKMRRSRRPKGRLARIRESVEGVLDEAEVKTADLRKRANKMRGDAKKRMQEEAQTLESREKELRQRLDEIKTEATKLFERARP